MELRIVKMIALVALWMGMTVGLHAQTVVEYIHTDALGTPVAVTDATGTVIERSVYEPYGQLINRPLTDGPGFTGHVQDAATGLTYMEQRYYDPIIGRFLSVDSVTADGNNGSNFNRYKYANNNPYRFTDPDGRFELPAWLRGMLGDRADESNSASSAFGKASSREMRREIQSEINGAGQSVDSVKQAVVENTSINAKGTISAGTGIQATKNIVGGNDSVGWIPVGEGAYAGVTADFEVLELDFSGGKTSPISFEVSGDAGAVGSIGGSVKIDLAGKVEVSVSVGLGAGEHVSFSPKLNVELPKEELK